MRKLEEEKKIKKEFNLLLRKNKGTNQLFEQIYNFYYYGRYTENSLRARIILSYMRDYLDRRGKIVTSKEEIKYLLLLFQNLYKNEKIALEGIRQMIDLHNDRSDKKTFSGTKYAKNGRSVSLLPGKKGRRKMCTGSRSHHSK